MRRARAEIVAHVRPYDSEPLKGNLNLFLGLYLDFGTVLRAFLVSRKRAL